MLANPFPQRLVRGLTHDDGQVHLSPDITELLYANHKDIAYRPEPNKNSS